jgi:hypothetical protein
MDATTYMCNNKDGYTYTLFSARYLIYVLPILRAFVSPREDAVVGDLQS